MWNESVEPSVPLILKGHRRGVEARWIGWGTCTVNIIELKPIYLFSAHANLFECVYPGSVPCAHKEKVPANSEQNKYKHPAPNLKGKKGRGHCFEQSSSVRDRAAAVLLQHLEVFPEALDHPLPDKPEGEMKSETLTP